MTTAKPPARYSAVEGALAGGSATAELHHPQGHDPLWPTSYAIEFPIVTKLHTRRTCGKASADAEDW